jgi:hypothetical protein
MCQIVYWALSQFSVDWVARLIGDPAGDDTAGAALWGILGGIFG